jgi:hypothetical protein
MEHTSIPRARRDGFFVRRRRLLSFAEAAAPAVAALVPHRQELPRGDGGHPGVKRFTSLRRVLIQPPPTTRAIWEGGDRENHADTSSDRHDD